VISALFIWDGTLIAGNEKIEVERHPHAEQGNRVWWFRVKETADDTFVRFPVIQSAVYELVGLIVGEQNLDARFWRWVAPQPLPPPPPAGQGCRPDAASLLSRHSEAQVWAVSVLGVSSTSAPRVAVPGQPPHQPPHRRAFALDRGPLVLNHECLPDARIVSPHS